MSSLTSALSAFTKRSELSRSPSATGASDEPSLHTNKPHLLMRARRLLGKAVPLAFTGYLMAIFIGAAATLAWQSYGGAVRQTIAGWLPQLGWLAPPAPPVAQTAPAPAPASTSAGASPDSLKATSLALAAVRQSVDKLAAELNKLQAQGAPDKTSTDKTSTDKTSTDKTSTDKTSTDKTSADKGSADKGSADKASADKTSASPPSRPPSRRL